MPKVTKSKESRTSDDSDLFIFNYDGKRVLVKRSQIRCYWDAVRTCRKLFSEIPEDYRIIFNTKNLVICDNEMAMISEDAWDVIIGQLSSLVITMEKPKVTVVGDNSKGISSSEVPRDAKISLKLSIYDEMANETTVDLRAPRSTTISRVYETVGVKTNRDPTILRLFYNGTRLDPYSTLESNDMEDGDVILCHLAQRGGKPVIYLSSPTPITASVTLSLAAQWDLSAIYPVVPIKPRTETTNQQVSWEVEVHSNGDLTELTTGLDVAYLFWEAQLTKKQYKYDNHSFKQGRSQPAVIFTTPCPSSKTNIEEVFYPNNTDLTDADSVVLPVDKITLYLDKALATLCLHTEARTSFITYWLPSLLKHKYVALRFVPQKSYEHAAPLAVSPAPDVITRVFMVFKGISEDELDQWSAATKRASEDVDMWKDVVGVYSELAHDATLFRVLEWGGMEVLPLANPQFHQ